MMSLEYDLYQSPVGEIFFAAQGDKLCFLDFNDNDGRIDKLLRQRFGDYELTKKPGLLDVSHRLDRYFQGDSDAFDEIELETYGTEFQQNVWRQLRKIDSGSSISYDQLARNVGNPKAVRAVASANARNPIAIIIPCHRVIGKNGSMRGYAGGVERKIWLLQHEGAIL